MSMVQNIIQAVTATQRQIDDQIAKLNAYKTQIDQVLQTVQKALVGSTQQYAEEMLQQLQQTKQQIDSTLQRLSIAKEKLSQVKMMHLTQPSRSGADAARSVTVAGQALAQAAGSMKALERTCNNYLQSIQK